MLLEKGHRVSEPVESFRSLSMPLSNPHDPGEGKGVGDIASDFAKGAKGVVASRNRDVRIPYGSSGQKEGRVRSAKPTNTRTNLVSTVYPVCMRAEKQERGRYVMWPARVEHNSQQG